MTAFPIEQFYNAAADGNDWIPAFQRAQESVGLDGHISLILGPRLYRCASQLDIWTAMTIQGEAPWRATQDATPQGPPRDTSTLHFDNSTHGLVIHFPTTYGPEPTARGRFVGREFVVHGTGHASAPGTFDIHGCLLYNRASFTGVTFRQFGGDGVHNNSTGGANDNNLQFFMGCRFYLNGRYGVYHEGGDANQGLFIACDWNDNGEQVLTEFGGVGVATQEEMNTIAQIYDDSFLGNHYIGCHVGGNVNGSNRPVQFVNASNKSTWVSGYLEGTVALDLMGNSLSLGSRSQLSPDSSGSAITAKAGRAVVRHCLEAENAREAGAVDDDGAILDTSLVVEGRLGSINLGMTAFEFQRSDDSAPYRMELLDRAAGGHWWELRGGGVNANRTLCIGHQSNGTYYGQSWYPNGAYLGRLNNNAPLVKFDSAQRDGIDVRLYTHNGSTYAEGFATAVPTGGTWSQSDKLWNSTATVGQPSGWICTVAGTPGTWVSMGDL